MANAKHCIGHRKAFRFFRKRIEKKIYTLLFKTYRHIIVSEICRLAESVTVVARTGDVEFYAYHFSQSAEVPFGPLGDDVIGAIDKIELQSTCLVAIGVVACSENLHPVFLANVGGR